MKRNTKRTHADLVKACLLELGARGWLAWEINVSARMRGFHVGRPGMADILAHRAFPNRAWRICKVAWIECKIPPDKQSELQRDFEKRVIAGGAHYWIVESAYDLTAFLESKP